MAILWKGFEWFSGKFQSCKFPRTCTRSDGFVWTAGAQYVAENALFIFTPGFLSIKLWCCERQTWRVLPSRHFGDGAQVQRKMEHCHVRWLLLDDEKGCSWNRIPSTGQKDMSLRSVIFYSYCTYNYDSAIISKTRANQWILELFSYSAAQKT